jgi:hypothetical protein
MATITNKELTKQLGIAKKFAKGATNKFHNKISIDHRGIQGTNGMIGVIIPMETDLQDRREVSYSKGEYTTSSVALGNTMDLYYILESMQIKKKYIQHFTVNRKDFIKKLEEMKSKQPYGNRIRIEADKEDGILILKGADPRDSFDCIHKDIIPAEMEINHEYVVVSLNIDYALLICNTVAFRDIKFQFTTIESNTVSSALYVTEENGNQYVLMPIFHG